MTAGLGETRDGAAGDALRFFDPTLADISYGLEMLTAVLTGAEPPQPIRIPPSDTAELVDHLRYHRLEPQLVDAVRDGRIVLESDDQQDVMLLSTMLAVYGLELEHLLVQAGMILNDAGIEFLVLKGMATRQLDMPDGTLRQAADVDLLVRESGYEAAAATLLGAGFSQPAEATTLMDKGGAWRTPDGRAVDLHTRPHTAGRNLDDHWWETAESFEVAGHEFRALSRGGRLAHAASHFALSFPNHRIMSSLYDLVAISRVSTEGDRAEAERFLVEIGVSDLAWRITSRAAKLVPGEAVIVGRRGEMPLDRILRKAYDRPDLDKAAVKLAKAYGMPWSGRRRVFRNWLFPSAGYLASGGYSSRLDRVISVVGRQLGHGVEQTADDFRAD